MAGPLNFRSPLASRFMGTVKAGGLTNPYGLAAVYSTGKHESSWAPENVFGAWADPSESGQPGQAGGALSWRAERLNNLRKFAKSRGDDPRGPSVETQAEFFLSEDPSLIEALQGATNATEAQSAMDNAWRFAGYDRPGGEAGRRLRTTRETLGEILGGEGGTSSLAGSTGSNGTEDAMAIRTGAPGGFSGGYGAANRLGQALNPSAAGQSAASPALPAPLFGPKRSEMLAEVLKNMKEESKKPNPQSWMETGLRALGQGVQGYYAGEKLREEDAEEQRQREVLAGILGGNSEAAALMQSGVGDTDDWAGVILKEAFKEPKEKKAPTVETFYTEGGQEQPHQWNPDTGEYEPVGGAKGTKPNAREQRAQMMMDNGVPPEIATGIASGQFVVKTNPYNQQPEVVNLADGKIVFDGSTQAGAPAASQGDPGAPVPEPAAPAAEQGQPSYIPENVDPTDATGASGFFGGVVNQISDLFGQGLPFPEIEDAAEALNTTQILTMSLLQAEIPGRPSKFLLEKLEKLTVDPKSLSRADERSITRLKQTRDLIQHEVDRVEKDILSRPHDFKPGDMTKARLNSSQLKGLLKAYDAMLGTVETRRDESKPGLEQFDRRRR